MYDVFLSHNRKQKQWVRKLYHYLISKGLNVFFDEESIPPGANIVTSIEEAIKNSRYVVLILSQSSIQSDWVAMEIQYTIHTDPSTKKGILLPIIIEKIDFNSLRLSIQSLNCIDLTRDGTREARLKYFLEHIGVRDNYDNDKFRDVLLVDQNVSDSEIKIGGVNEILNWGWDGIRLLDEFIKLDYETLENLIPSHEGQSSQWAPIFMNHPDTWRMLYSESNRIIGYWHFAPLFEDSYELAKQGILLDSEITADRVQFFEFEGWYKIYFVQICMLPKYRTTRNVRQLFQAIFTVLESLTKDGIFIKEICANAYTDIGRALCKSFSMQYLCEHKEYGSIYYSSIFDLLNSPIAGAFTHLKETYYNAKNA